MNDFLGRELNKGTVVLAIVPSKKILHREGEIYKELITRDPQLAIGEIIDIIEDKAKVKFSDYNPLYKGEIYLLDSKELTILYGKQEFNKN